MPRRCPQSPARRALRAGLRQGMRAACVALALGGPARSEIILPAPAAAPAAAPTTEARRLDAALRAGLAATAQLYSTDPAPGFLGSGFLYGPEAWLVTNHHVTGGALEVLARFADGTELRLRRQLGDPARDLAIYATEGLAPVPGLSAAPQPPLLGQTLFALGAPLDLGQSVTRGGLSHRGRQVDPAVPLRLYQHDAATNPGASGGPLLNEAGQVVAVNARIADGSRFFTGVAFAIPVATLDALLAGKLAPVPRLGLRLRPLGPEARALLGLPPGTTGLLIDDVSANSPAADAGLQPGDVLLTLAGAPLPAPGALAFALEARPGDLLPLSALRPGTGRLDLTLILSEPPAPDTAPTPAPGALPRPLGLTLDPAGRRVVTVAPDSPAFAAGLAEGDEIMAVNGAAGVPPALTADRPQLLRLSRDGRQLHLLLDPGAEPSLARPVTGNALDPAVIPF